jgi:adenylyltransferase/sulfurtransferase
MASGLSTDETQRYRRQLIMPEIGVTGQKRLKEATVMVAGVGGLGGLSACYLAAAGVGRLKIVDGDRVAVHNLNRQILYTTAEIGQWKTDCARQRLTALNPLCQVAAINASIQPDTVARMVQGCGLIIDGTDTLETRGVLNQAALTMGIPFIFGG